MVHREAVDELAAGGETVQEHLVTQLVALPQTFEELDEFLRVDAVAVLEGILVFRIERGADHDHIAAFRPIPHPRSAVALAARPMNPDHKLIGLRGIHRIRRVNEAVHALRVLDHLLAREGGNAGHEQREDKTCGELHAAKASQGKCADPPFCAGWRHSSP